MATASETLDLEKMALERLSPELEPYVEETKWGKMLRHPLVYDMMMVVPGLANRRLEQKKQMLEEAIERDDFSQIVALHERPYRFDAFMEFVKSPDSRTIWDEPRDIQDVLMYVWTDSENIGQYQDEWVELFSDRPPGAVLGRDEELAEFQKLPDEIQVYRGGDDPSSFLSWTTDLKVAEFFARREDGEVIHKRVVQKSGVFAYLTRRNESEILTFEGTP